jgi:hypothetical protein
MVIAECNLNQLIDLESILFAAEWDNNPHIPSFSIKCGNELYNYKVIKAFGKYRIITN